MRDPETFRNALRDDENVQQLLDRLAFVERFHAVIVKCEMPRVANVLVEVVTEALAPLRGQTIHVRRLDPYVAHTNLLEKISPDLLLDEVLGKLLTPPAESSESFVLTIVDASRAMPGDDDAWSLLFQRMNERRNALVRAVSGAFLILAPRRYDVLFARAASDFWSIVGAIVDVPTPPIHDRWREWLTDPVLLVEMVNRRLAETAEVGRQAAERQQENEQRLNMARDLWAKEPKNSAARGYLAVQLLLAGRAAHRVGQIQLAEQHFQEGIELLELDGDLINDDLMNHGMVSANYSMAYSMRAVLRISMCRLEAALDDLNTAEQYARKALISNPPMASINELLMSCLLLRGNVQRFLGRPGAAITDLLEGISILRKQANNATFDSVHALFDRIDRSLGLVDNLADLACAYCDQADYDAALGCCDEAHEILAQLPSLPRVERIRGNALMSMIHVQFLRGDMERCYSLTQNAIKSAKFLLLLVHEQVMDRRALGTLHVMMAEIQEQRGNLAETKTSDRLALETLEPLLQSSPPDPIAVKLAEAIRVRGETQPTQ